MVSIEDEWSEYVKASAFKSKNTIASYKNAHGRLTDYLEKPNPGAKWFGNGLVNAL